MAILETAGAYVLGILMNNEEVKKFPKEFIDESVKWVKSWFLTPQDPVTTTILSDENQAEAVKKSVIDAKLKALASNTDFMKELEDKLKTYAIEKRNSYNTMEDIEIVGKGNFRQGNTGETHSSSTGDRNTMKRVKINIDGDFRQGDDFK